MKKDIDWPEEDSWQNMMKTGKMTEEWTSSELLMKIIEKIDYYIKLINYSQCRYWSNIEEEIIDWYWYSDIINEADSERRQWNDQWSEGQKWLVTWLFWPLLLDQLISVDSWFDEPINDERRDNDDQCQWNEQWLTNTMEGDDY